MEILDLVRRAASRRVSEAEIAAQARNLAGEWRAAEQAVGAEIAAGPRRARRLVAAFARVAAASGVREARGRAARLAASLATYEGRFDDSRRACIEAIALLDGAAKDGARLGLAAAEMRRGRFPAAVALCRAVRRAARRRDDAALVAGADLNEAIALHESGRPRSAVPLYERARRGCAAAKNRRLEARATMNLANAHVLLDRYAEAAPLYESAARAFAESGQSLDAAYCLYNRGALCVSMERLGEADETLREAEAALRAAGDSTYAALARLDRGEAMLKAGLAPEARRLLDSARRGIVRGAPPGERLRAALLAARAALVLGDAAGARRLAAVRTPRGFGGAHAERGEIAGRALAAEKRFVAARRRLERAAKAFGSARPAGRARCRAAAAWCALESGDAAGARRLAASATKSGAPLGVAGLDFATAAVEFLVESRFGRRAAADRALARSVEALERVRAGLGPDAMRAALMSGREAWLAQAMRHVLDGPGGAEAALALVERFRARALVDLLGAADAAAPRDGRVAALRARVAVLERRADGAPQPAFLRSSAAAAAPRALRAAERALADASSSADAPLADAVDLRRLRGSLPEGTLVVSLFADERDGYVFAADRDGVRVVSTAGGVSVVAALVESLRYSLGKFALGDDYARRHADRLSRETDALFAALAALSIGPIADAVSRARRVVVVPHGPWHRVPFAALPLAGGRLVEHAAVAFAPALGALAVRCTAPRGAPLVLSVADATAPTIDAEGRAVAAALPGAVHLDGDAARFDALAAADAPSCVHVAAHGRFRADAPALSGVRLADGWLRALDFASLRLPGALVVLSGCETGVTRVGPGDEVEGLVRGVFASGAAELLASLWRVGDVATARFMTDFHARRAAGVSSEAALVGVQRDAARAGRPVWAWAGFGLWTRRLVDA